MSLLADSDKDEIIRCIRGNASATVDFKNKYSGEHPYHPIRDPIITRARMAAGFMHSMANKIEGQPSGKKDKLSLKNIQSALEKTVEEYLVAGRDDHCETKGAMHTFHILCMLEDITGRNNEFCADMIDSAIAVAQKKIAAEKSTTWREYFENSASVSRMQR